MSTSVESSDYLDERYFDLRFQDVTIQKGDSTGADGDTISVSEEFYVKDKLLVAVEIVPNAVGDCWTAAALTWLASPTTVSTDFLDVYDDTGTNYAVTAGVSQHILLTPSHFSSMRYLKVRSGTAATPVDQAADRTVRLWYRSA